MNQIASMAGSNGQEPGTRSHVKILIKVSVEEHPATIQISSWGTTLKGAWEETTLPVECAQTLRGENHSPRKPAKLLPSSRDKFCALMWQATVVSVKAKVGGACIPKAKLEWNLMKAKLSLQGLWFPRIPVSRGLEKLSVARGGMTTLAKWSSSWSGCLNRTNL